MNCPRPGCTKRLFATADPDEWWCIDHGPIYVRAPLDLPKREPAPRLPATHAMGGKR